MNRTRNSIAIAALAACASFPAFAVDSLSLYGVIDLSARLSKDQPAPGQLSGGPITPSTAIASGGLRPSRIGFKGGEDLGGGTRAFFQLEAGFDAANGAGSSGGGLAFNRESVLGLSQGAHTLTLGRIYSEAYRSIFAFDPLGYMVPGANPNAIAASLNDVSGFGNSATGASRLNSAARYEGRFDNLGLSAHKSFDTLAGGSSNGSHGAGFTYNFPTVLAGGSATRLNAAAGGVMDAYVVGAKWAVKPDLSLAATYARQEVKGGALNNYGREIASVGAFYESGRVGYGLAYYGTRAETVNGVAGFNGSQNKLVGLTTYKLSPSTTLYGEIDVARNRGALSAPAPASTSVYGTSLGVNHSF